MVIWPKNLSGLVVDASYGKQFVCKTVLHTDFGSYIRILDTTVVEVPWDANVFGRHSDVPLYFHMSDLSDLASENQEINITILQLWMM